MMKKRIVSIVLAIVAGFLAWYMYQEYKKSQVIVVPTEVIMEEVQ